MEQRAILVVEDTAAIAEIIETVLNDIPNYQATAVVNGADALAFVAEVAVDLVLLDINMPGLDGFAVHDLLRARPETATVPILFMTAGRHDEEFARRGVRGHIKKPFDLDNLLVRVASALAGGGGAVSNGRVLPRPEEQRTD
jgi:putative two-component system response regulator